ncbi:MAG: ATP-dependent Clp protease ATP-binding subunit ClpC, partial [Symbiobacteriaceae bacterium]|nr:ATP-dependent Clp protease ATP-binding subunit ClpC [Symbiobacteriaceae bacterium]
TFRPEFLNRIDEIIVFHHLSQEEIREIVGIMVRQVQQRLAELRIRIVLDNDAVDYLMQSGFDPVYGARPLRRAIQNQIEDKLSDEMIMGRIIPDTVVNVSADAEGLVFRV